MSKNHLLKLANTRHTPDTGGHRAEGGQTLYLTYFFTFLDIFFLMLSLASVVGLERPGWIYLISSIDASEGIQS